MDAAQIEEPPSKSKRLLIGRFLIASGIQSKIDKGSFLDRHAMPGTKLFDAAVEGRSAEESKALRDLLKSANSALRSCYEPYRAIWQEEYETHVNWEFTEDELKTIVDFLENSAGQHFLEGLWRMDAYITTNTEDLIEEILTGAMAKLRKP